MSLLLGCGSLCHSRQAHNEPHFLALSGRGINYVEGAFVLELLGAALDLTLTATFGAFEFHL